MLESWHLAPRLAVGCSPSFKYSAKRVNTSLAGHVWRLKDGNHPFNIKWKALATYPNYNPSTNSCGLCLMEKFTIMCKPELATELTIPVKLRNLKHDIEG